MISVGESPKDDTMDRTKHRKAAIRDDGGATLVEFAVIFPLLILLIIGTMEFGLAFKDYLTLSRASREGANAGATAANDVTADIQILSAIEKAFGGDLDSLDDVVISDPDGSTSTTYTYTGAAVCAWTPCPDPFAGATDFGAPYQEPSYVPSDRDVSAPNVGRVQVDITFTHDWVTNLIGSTSVWTKTSLTRLEPRIFE